MAYFLFVDRITIDTIASWFDECPDEFVQAFAWQKADKSYVTLQDFFKAHFHNCLCRYKLGEEAIAKAKFHMIFSENVFLAMKVKNLHDHILADLHNFDLYQDEVKSSFNNTLKGNNNQNTTNSLEMTQERNLIQGSLRGASSTATMGTMRDKTRKAIETRTLLEKSENKILDYLDPNTKDMEQLIEVYGGKDKHVHNTHTNTTGSSSNTGSGTTETASSNPFKDRLAYLRLEVPKFREEFLECFRIMFHM